MGRNAERNPASPEAPLKAWTAPRVEALAMSQTGAKPNPSVEPINQNGTPFAS